MAFKDGLKDKQDCENCKITRLMPGNYLAWDLIAKAAPGLFDGYGGVHYDAIEYVFNLHNIPEWQRIELHDKFLVYIEEMKESWK